MLLILAACCVQATLAHASHVHEQLGKASRVGGSRGIGEPARNTPRAVRPWRGLILEPAASLETAGPIGELRADGSLVAAESAPTSSTCDDIVIWNPVTGHDLRPVSHLQCPDAHHAESEGFASIALAGRRFTWIAYRVSSLTDGSLASGDARVAALGVIGAPRRPDEQNPDYNPSLEDFTLDASGDLVARTSSDTCVNEESGLSGDAPCHALTKVFVRSGHAWRWLWGASELARVANIDGGRIAVQRNGEVLILARSGAVLDDLAVPRGGQVQARLVGDRVVALAGRTLRIYATDGTQIAAWRLPSTRRPVLDDARGDVAVYSDGPLVHLIDFVDGRHASITTPGVESAAGGGIPGVLAQLEAMGLIYSYSRASSPQGQLEFVTSAALRKLLGGGDRSSR